ncbi:MAG: hypothetical protein ACT6FC_04055 [Methanosarcinaceae archaeon]
MNNKIIFLFLLSAVLIFSSGCTDVKSNDPTGMIPVGSDLIASVDLNAILSDKMTGDIYDKSAKPDYSPQSFEDAMDEIENETGIDVRKINEIVFFADFEGEHGGAFITGTFDSENFVDTVVSEENLEKGTYRGYEYYFENDYQGKPSGSIIILDDGIVLFAYSVEVLENIIDIKEGDENPLSTGIMEKYNLLDDGIFKLALQVPDIYKDEIAGNSGEFNFESFSSIDIVTYLYQKKSSVMTNTMTIYSLDSTSAEDMADVIDGIIKVTKGGTSDQSIKDLLSGIEITQKDSMVTVKSSITEDDLEEMTTKMSEMGNTGFYQVE